MSDDIKIMVCCHKECEVPTGDIYLPIHVGRAISKCKLDMQGDNEVNGEECDNISAKNVIYCEMTAMYWAWKNIRTLYPNIKYVGLCHYRRYFYLKNNAARDLSVKAKHRVKVAAKTLLAKKLSIELCDLQYRCKSLSEAKLDECNQELDELIKTADIVTTKCSYVTNINIRDFFSTIGKEYINVLDEIIDDSYQEYSDSYNKMMAGNKFHTANMIIMRTEMLDEYCEFIFGVLNRHREIMTDRGYLVNVDQEKIYARISGYLSEILTSVYIEAQRGTLKIKEVSKMFIV